MNWHEYKMHQAELDSVPMVTRVPNPLCEENQYVPQLGENTIVIKATEIEIVVTLTVENPLGSKPLNVIDLSEWLGDQLPSFIALPFDGQDWALLVIDVGTTGEGTIINYEDN